VIFKALSPASFADDDPIAGANLNALINVTEEHFYGAQIAEFGELVLTNTEPEKPSG